MKVFVDDSGEQSPRTLIFLHGFPFNHSMWEAQAALARPRFRVISYDLRGLGKSEVGSGQYAFEFYVDDLLELMDSRKVDKAVLCGLSMGGYIALRAAERAPERVSGLILANTRSAADSNEAKIKRSETAKTIQNKGVEAFSEGFLKAVLTLETLAAKRTVVARVRQMMLANEAAGMIGAVLAMAGRTDTTESLAKIQAPTLVIGGEKDPIIPPAVITDLQKRIAGSRLALIPDAAHLSNLENPEAFNRHFQDFLQSII